MKQDNYDQNDSIRFKKRGTFANVSIIKQKKLIKAKDLISIKEWIQFSNEKGLLMTLVDSEIKINSIYQVYEI